MREQLPGKNADTIIVDDPHAPSQEADRSWWYEDKTRRRAAMDMAAAGGANRAMRRKVLSDMKRARKTV